MHSLSRHSPSQTIAIRLLFVLLALTLWLLLSGFGAPGANPTPADSDRLTQTELYTLRASPAPAITAHAAALVDVETGRVLWSLDGNRRLPMASTTKMMTALLATELAGPDEVATAQPRDLVGGSSIDLRPGERLTLEQLLYGALIPSGNDAAVTIADYVGREHLGGAGDRGIDAFVRAMNAKAKKLGLKNSRFQNPNGFDAPNHYSSALDLARLGREVLRDPLLSKIVGTARYRVTGYTSTGRGRTPIYHQVETTNDLLGAYRGVDGIKTGTTSSAGEVLVASAKRGNPGLIAVVLGATDRFGDARALLNWGFSTYKWVPLASLLFGAQSSPTANQVGYAATARWNTDLTFSSRMGDAPRYWIATEPLHTVPLAGDRP